MDETQGRRRVSRRLQRWRRDHGGPGRRIPEELWELAADVARVEGVEETARALRLDSARLEREVAGSQVVATAQTAPLEYVELGASEVGLTTQRASLEVVTAGGDRLRIEVVGTLDVPGVVRAFAERGS